MDIASFRDVGHEMYRDRDRFHATFVEADLLKLDESNGEAVGALRGDMDVIWISNMLHQWDWGAQAKALLQIISSSNLGTIVAGRHAGMTPGGLFRAYEGHKGSYMHDGETWRRLWKQVGR